MAKPLFNANIQEYAGYTPPNQIDFNKIFDEAEKDIGGIIQAREQERAKNEEFASATEKALTDFSTNVNQDFSTFVGEGLNNYRNLNLQYYKQLKNNEINSTQYRMLVNRIQEDWGEFGEFSKNFEARLKDITDRETAGTSSKIEYDFFGQKISKASDFGNKSLIPDPKSGGLFMVTTGADGKEVKEAITTRSLNNFQRQKVDKFDLMSSIEKQTDIVNKQNSRLSLVLQEKSAEISTFEGGISKWLAENRPELQGDYDAFIAGVKGSVMKQPPNAVASALVDNLVPMEPDKNSPSGYKAVPGQDWFMYESDAELKEKVKGGADKRFGIKMVQQGDGSLAAQLSKDQEKYLDASIKRIADAQIGYKETIDVRDETPEERRLREVELQKIREQGDIAQTKLQQEGQTTRAQMKIDADDDKGGDDVTFDPYTDTIRTVLKDKDTTQLVANNPDLVKSSRFSPDGKTIFVTNALNEEISFDMTTETGQIAFLEFLYPDRDKAELTKDFKRDRGQYSDAELTSHQAGIDESISIDAPTFTTTDATGDEITFEDMVKGDFDGDYGKKLKFVQDLFTQGGVRTSDQITLDLDEKGSSFMRYNYTSPNGLKVSSDKIYKDYFLAPDEKEANAIQNTLNEMSNNIYQIENKIYVPAYEELDVDAKILVAEYADKYNKSNEEAIQDIVDGKRVTQFKLY